MASNESKLKITSGHFKKVLPTKNYLWTRRLDELDRPWLLNWRISISEFWLIENLDALETCCAQIGSELLPFHYYCRIWTLLESDLNRFIQNRIIKRQVFCQKFKMRFKPVTSISFIGLVCAQNFGFIKCTQGCIRSAKPNNILALYECQKLCQIRNGLKNEKTFK